MKSKTFIQTSTLSVLAAVVVYLFVSAPPPLVESNNANKAKKSYSINEAFTMLAIENAHARTIYTKSIVGQSKAKGLAYSEHWMETHEEAGPLPALFLRHTAMEIEKTGIGLGLYLGSDFPISQANLFKGVQAKMFEGIKADRQPRFFFDDDTKRYTAMFADIAGAEACVSCHNLHEKSPKKDWKLNDVMGATTWSFAKDSLSGEEMIELLKIYRKGVEKTYGSYVHKTKTFKSPPVITEGFLPTPNTLPSTQAFLDSFSRASSPQIFVKLIK